MVFRKQFFVMNNERKNQIGVICVGNWVVAKEKIPEEIEATLRNLF